MGHDARAIFPAEPFRLGAGGCGTLSLHTGGGFVLLKDFVNSINSNYDYVIIIDERAEIEADTKVNISTIKIKPTILNRILINLKILMSQNISGSKMNIEIKDGNTSPITKQQEQNSITDLTKPKTGTQNSAVKNLNNGITDKASANSKGTSGVK